MGRPIIDITGRRFGRLTVLRRAGMNTNAGHALWKCECSCGNVKVVDGQHLRNGHTQSCGCLHQERTGQRFLKHGGSYTLEHASWRAMRQRCSNPKHPAYPEYAGRGITVCERWQNSFEAFFEDMGPKPSPKHSIDRIDGDLGYFPQKL